MSTDKAAAGMPNRIIPKEVLWGRQGLGPDYYGPDLIAEALREVFNTAELDRLRNFTSFHGAFMDHAFRTGWRVSESTRYYPCDEIKLHPEVTEFDLKEVIGVGIFGTRYGLAEREDKSVRPSPHRWVSSEEWDLITYACDERRKSEPGHMPSEQVTHMSNHRVFLSRSRKLIVFTCHWRADRLLPESYLPTSFTADQIESWPDIFDITPQGLHRFCESLGASAGSALLNGFTLQLQSSNYQVRQELEKNEKAEAMAKTLLSRIKT